MTQTQRTQQGTEPPAILAAAPQLHVGRADAPVRDAARMQVRQRVPHLLGTLVFNPSPQFRHTPACAP